MGSYLQQQIRTKTTTLTKTHDYGEACLYSVLEALGPEYVHVVLAKFPAYSTQFRLHFSAYRTRKCPQSNPRNGGGLDGGTTSPPSRGPRLKGLRRFPCVICVTIRVRTLRKHTLSQKSQIQSQTQRRHCRFWCDRWPWGGASLRIFQIFEPQRRNYRKNHNNSFRIIVISSKTPNYCSEESWRRVIILQNLQIVSFSTWLPECVAAWQLDKLDVYLTNKCLYSVYTLYYDMALNGFFDFFQKGRVSYMLVLLTGVTCEIDCRPSDRRRSLLMVRSGIACTNKPVLVSTQGLIWEVQSNYQRVRI